VSLNYLKTYSINDLEIQDLRKYLLYFLHVLYKLKHIFILGLLSALSFEYDGLGCEDDPPSISVVYYTFYMFYRHLFCTS